MKNSEAMAVCRWAATFGPPLTIGMTYRDSALPKDADHCVAIWVTRGKGQTRHVVRTMLDFYAFVEGLHTFLADVRTPIPTFFERHLLHIFGTRDLKEAYRHYYRRCDAATKATTSVPARRAS